MRLTLQGFVLREKESGYEERVAGKFHYARLALVTHTGHT
jgi:hypothetical protein